MKVKTLFVILAVSLSLLAYFSLCNYMLNQNIWSNTKADVYKYLINVDDSFDFKKATINDNGTINVFVHNSKNYYYRFVFLKEKNIYTLIEVNKDIPAYIKL